MIGDTKITDITTRYLEKYYQQLLKTPAVPTVAPRKNKNALVGTSTIRDVHKILRSCFEQAVKWELMEKNPAIYATVPKYKANKREIWTAETLMYATEVCEDEILKLAMNLSFSASLRIGELCGLTWDCVDISQEAVQGDSGHAQVNMVTDVYSHILDEDRKRNAELFEEAFYGKKNLNPQMIDAGAEKMITVPDGVDAETLMKVLGNPEMVALLSSLAKTIQK